MTDNLVKRLRDLAEEWFEMCDDIHEPLTEAANRIEDLEAQLKTVLDREAETHRRHDAKVEAQAAEIERLRNWSLKAFTIVEWVVGKGNVLEYPCSDAEPCAICDGVELLGAYPAAHARAALGDE